MASQTYLTTEELAVRIKYDSRTIRDRLKDSVLLEGRHYILQPLTLPVYPVSPLSGYRVHLQLSVVRGIRRSAHC
jgi:hypothetical protein